MKLTTLQLLNEDRISVMWITMSDEIDVTSTIEFESVNNISTILNPIVEVKLISSNVVIHHQQI